MQLALAALPAAAQQLSKPGERFPSVTSDGAWCWFADPRAFYHGGDKKQTYIGWVDSAGFVKALSFDHDNLTSQTFDFGKVQKDDHANPALLMLPDRKLMIFYSAHAGPKMFHRTSTNAEDIADWQPEKEVPVNTSGTKGYTYPNPYILPKENNRLYLFWRGGNFNPTFATSDDFGTSWSGTKTLIEVQKHRPYVKYVSNGEDTIHFAFTDGHPRNQPLNNIYYACYRDGALYGAGGRRIKSMAELPLRPEEADLVYSAEKNESARAWIWDIALDKQERPVIAYTALHSNEDHRYRYAAWDGNAWSDNEITTAGGTIDGPREPHYTGGIAIDHSNPGSVYLSRQAAGGLHELEHWFTETFGREWESHPITEKSAQKNVRPIVVRNHKPPMAVVWMHGEYPTYTTYNTQLKYIPALVLAVEN